MAFWFKQILLFMLNYFRYQRIVLILVALFYIGFIGCRNINTANNESITDKTIPDRSITIPTIDISQDTFRQVVIAQGTKEVRQGHPNTVLMPDGKTIFVIWTLGHGGPCGQLKKKCRRRNKLE